MASTWHTHLQTHLHTKLGATTSKSLLQKYQHAFPINYTDDWPISMVGKDILQLEKLTADHTLEIDFYETKTNGISRLHLRLYQLNQPIPLADILPILENFDLRTLDEKPYQVRLTKSTFAWISDFNVVYVGKIALNMSAHKNTKINFQEALLHIHHCKCESDGFNKLILGAGISWREVIIIRTYAKYMQQTGFRFSQAYIEKTIANYPELAKNFLALFFLKYNPATKPPTPKKLNTIQDTISANLEKAVTLDEDLILRSFWQLLNATLRTNYFLEKSYLSIKLDSNAVPNLPKPYPLYEIFVYSPRFEGIHLRSEKVSRGGIRWSDRPEDFRTEVLGLMKAQKVKNAVIVPSGAKGGFVLKSLAPDATRDEIKNEVVACYQSFIRSLLDLTDNIKGTKIIKPKNVVCYDDDDPYLVVAADKGTATFSDIANTISQEYNFWLGDAFASGGSAGYDHKKMGITARGAWESICRHFQELNMDAKTAPITVIGIGDMSGDVFGNGLIYSSSLKLVAAFDHRNIFIDPNPNPEKSYNERLRLFNLPTSSWEDYSAKLISKGGGVFSRRTKAIALTPEIKDLLQVTENSLPPNELIRKILMAKVDLFFNGGIGTYVKSSSESHADVGDKTNDFCRINGDELQVKVVGEGGNLGFTQLGRVEYAMNNGLINTDFIDNSAGVDTSDHEVNLKILFAKDVTKNILPVNKRNQILAKMTAEVAELVLTDNYNQALAISFSTAHSAHYISLYQAYIKELETTKKFNRKVEFIPDDKKLVERKASGLGLSRPELAVLLAYTKINLKNAILQSDIPEDPYYLQTLTTAFPPAVLKDYAAAISQHYLRREIIATQLSNYLVNTMGITFVYRLQTETGASIADIIRAHTVTAKIYDVDYFQSLVDSLDFKVALSVQYELLHHTRHLLNLATRWFLRGNRLRPGITTLINHYGPIIKKLETIVPELMIGLTKNYMETLTEQFVIAGLSTQMAKQFAISRAMYTALNIIETATTYKLDPMHTAKIYFAIGGRFNLVWFRDQIANDNREGHWNTLARLTLRDELDNLQRELTVAILQRDKKELDATKLIDNWINKYNYLYARWEKILTTVFASPSIDYTIFFISLRELADLVKISLES
jgi:glutamate dehydrogenase